MTRDPRLEGRSPAISLIWLGRIAFLNLFFWWNTFKILLLNYWPLRTSRHLAMIATVQKLVWGSSEIRPTPHKTNHKIWNQENENVIFVTASWCITRVSDTSITCHWQELKCCQKYWPMMPFMNTMVTHNYFCLVDSVEFVPLVAKTAQIYGFLYMCKAIEFWQRGTSMDSINTYK